MTTLDHHPKPATLTPELAERIRRLLQPFVAAVNCGGQAAIETESATKSN